jgi:hypothetical protein
MSISAISSPTTQVPARFQQIRSDFQSLQNDLQAGNIASAQADFASLLKDAPRLQSELQNGSASAVASTATDFGSSQASAVKELSTSLQAGDVSGAQSALATLQQTIGGAHRHHHHRHHHGDWTGSGSASDTGANGAVPLDRQQIQSDFKALSDALQSGDLTSAQQALAQLQKDDPRLAGSASATPTTSTASV